MPDPIPTDEAARRLTAEELAAWDADYYRVLFRPHDPTEELREASWPGNPYDRGD